VYYNTQKRAVCCSLHGKPVKSTAEEEKNIEKNFHLLPDEKQIRNKKIF
jgi:hypothetical protein